MHPPNRLRAIDSSLPRRIRLLTGALDPRHVHVRIGKAKIRHVEATEEADTSAATTPGTFALDRFGLWKLIRCFVQQKSCQCFDGTNGAPQKPQALVSDSLMGT
jgi:hypothetical protein